MKRAIPPSAAKKNTITKQARRRKYARRTRQFESAISGLRVDKRLRRPTVPAWFRLPDISRISSGWHASKLLSAGLLVFVVGSLYWLHVDDSFFIYREDVHFRNLGYLQGDELYDMANLDTWNALWIEPQQVAAQVAENPYVAAADVEVQLPGSISIDVVEEQPTALWVTDEGVLWLMADGSALPMRQPADERILQIVDGLQEARAPGNSDGSAIDMNVLNSARSLMERLPTLSGLRYNATQGINFALPDSDVYVYWGDGHDVETKLRNLQAAQLLIARGEATGTVLDLRSLTRPYFQ